MAVPTRHALHLPVPEPSASPVVVRRGRATVIAAAPAEVVTAHGAAALDLLDQLGPGWWAGFLSYDLGRAVETVDERLPPQPGLPDVVLARYDARLVLDDGGTHLEGTSAARAELEALLERAPRPRDQPSVGRPTSSLGPDAFAAGVRTVLELIEAGECYQVNLTRRLTWDSAADPVALFHALRHVNPAPHESLLVLPGPTGPLAIVSSSPERFLAWRGRDVETRPIKGTAVDGERLRTSAKDRAENVMIVDLARNDLGRVCEYGTVEVSELLGVERHPGLVHLVSTVRGRIRDDVRAGGLVRATFPPASVTGAPKPRVLQAIEDLEPVRRGAYCGALGWIDTERDEADLAVAIRTFTIADGRTMLGVGGGIVADSEPSAEWAETELKARRLLAALGSPGRAP